MPVSRLRSSVAASLLHGIRALGSGPLVRSAFAQSRSLSSASISASFERRVGAAPSSTLLDVSGQGLRWTGKEMKTHVDAAFNGLREFGVLPGATVGLWLVDGAEKNVLEIAVAKAGASVAHVKDSADAAYMRNFMQEFSPAGLLVSLDMQENNAVDKVLEDVFPELQNADRIIEGSAVKFSGHPGLRFIAHTGSVNIPGTFRLRDMLVYPIGPARKLAHSVSAKEGQPFAFGVAEDGGKGSAVSQEVAAKKLESGALFDGTSIV